MNEIQILIQTAKRLATEIDTPPRVVASGNDVVFSKSGRKVGRFESPASAESTASRINAALREWVQDGTDSIEHQLDVAKTRLAYVVRHLHKAVLTPVDETHREILEAQHQALLKVFAGWLE